MKAAGLNWPLGIEWDEDRLELALFPPGKTPATPPQRATASTSKALVPELTLAI